MRFLIDKYLQNMAFQDLILVVDELHQLLIELNYVVQIYQKHFDMLHNSSPRARTKNLVKTFDRVTKYVLFVSFPKNSLHSSKYHTKQQIYQHFDVNTMINLDLEIDL
jgi:hypothetical protein